MGAVSKNPADQLTTHLISKPITVSEHFLIITNDHSADDITRIPLKLIKSNRDSV